MLTQYYSPEPGAASLRLEAMAQQLKKHGHQVIVVTAHAHHLGANRPLAARDVLILREEVRGIPVFRTWIWRVSTGRFWMRLFNYFSFVVTSFFALFRVARADYVIVESPPLFLGITAWGYGVITKTPYILSVSDLWPESAIALDLVTNSVLIQLTRWLEHFLYRHAAYVSAVTEGIRYGVIATGEIAPGKVLFFPNGVDMGVFQRVSLEPPLKARLAPHDEKIFLYPGTLGYAQGLDIIIDAARNLRDRPDIRFLLVGEGPMREYLQRRVRQLELTNVDFEPLQPVDRMSQYFSLAHAVIVPLKRHRLFRGARPSKVFPAWAASTPVIYCGEGEMADLVIEAGGGMVVPPEDGAALARTIETLADLSYEQWRQISSAGHQYVLDHYTWERIAERWLRDLGTVSPSATPP